MKGANSMKRMVIVLLVASAIAASGATAATAKNWYWGTQKARSYVRNSQRYTVYENLSDGRITAPLCAALYAPKRGGYREFLCSFKYSLVESLGYTCQSFTLKPVNAWTARMLKVREEDCP